MFYFSFVAGALSITNVDDDDDCIRGLHQKKLVLSSSGSWHDRKIPFLTRHLPVVSRTGKTEYQLLLMKASDRGRNVNLGILIGCVLMNYYNNNIFQPNESIHRGVIHSVDVGFLQTYHVRRQPSPSPRPNPSPAVSSPNRHITAQHYVVHNSTHFGRKQLWKHVAMSVS